jgi:hypothetical protein
MLSIQKTNIREQLLGELYKYLLLFHPDQAAKLPEHQEFEYRIELSGE